MMLPVNDIWFHDHPDFQIRHSFRDDRMVFPIKVVEEEIYLKENFQELLRLREFPHRVYQGWRCLAGEDALEYAKREGFTMIECSKISHIGELNGNCY